MSQVLEKRPTATTAYQLGKVAVTLADKNSLLLKCDNCQQAWSPNLLTAGRLPKGYWKCPNGCNHF